MSITLHLSADAERVFRQAWGEQLDRKGLEAMVAAGYREKMLSLGKVAELLGLATTHEADQWLAEHGVVMNYAVEDLRQDARSLDDLRRTRP